VIAGGRVFCHFGTFGTACVNAETGEVLWRQKLEITHIVGPGSSPVVAGNVLVVTCDGGDEQYVAGLSTETGDIVWKTPRPPIREQDPDQRKAFCTPLVIEVNGKQQAVVPGAQWFVAYDPETGKELWQVDHGRGFSNVPSPVFDGKFVYLCTGFGKPQLWAVRPDGSGDVSDTHVVWRQKQQIGARSSAVVSCGRIYVISDAGVASCLKAETGEPIWRERIPGNYSASPIVGDGRVYFQSQEGRTTVIADAAEFKVLATNDLNGMQMASPAAVDGDLLLRTDTHLYRVGDGGAAAQSRGD
jgi:outer membrane protein assembly factor BamB